ncbi:hypothetical protein DFH09DRAFT_1106907 [Mycena vulgaris]|nr:hypothetical protein DFH09DRAFT_1106907 [Mycena vulgaris]
MFVFVMDGIQCVSLDALHRSQSLREDVLTLAPNGTIWPTPRLRMRPSRDPASHLQLLAPPTSRLGSRRPRCQPPRHHRRSAIPHRASLGTPPPMLLAPPYIVEASTGPSSLPLAVQCSADPSRIPRVGITLDVASVYIMRLCVACPLDPSPGTAVSKACATRPTTHNHPQRVDFGNALSVVPAHSKGILAAAQDFPHLAFPRSSRYSKRPGSNPNPELFNRDTDINRQHGSAIVSGNFGKDAVRLSPYTAPPQFFLLANKLSDNVVPYMSSGILGLAYQNTTQGPSFPMSLSLDYKGQLASAEMTFWLDSRPTLRAVNVFLARQRVPHHIRRPPHQRLPEPRVIHAGAKNAFLSCVVFLSIVGWESGGRVGGGEAQRRVYLPVPRPPSSSSGAHLRARVLRPSLTSPSGTPGARVLPCSLPSLPPHPSPLVLAPHRPLFHPANGMVPRRILSPPCNASWRPQRVPVASAGVVSRAYGQFGALIMAWDSPTDSSTDIGAMIDPGFASAGPSDLPMLPLPPPESPPAVSPAVGQSSEPRPSAPRSRRPRQEVDVGNILHTTRPRAPNKRFAEHEDISVMRD